MKLQSIKYKINETGQWFYYITEASGTVLVKFCERYIYIKLKSLNMKWWRWFCELNLNHSLTVMSLKHGRNFVKSTTHGVISIIIEMSHSNMC